MMANSWDWVGARWWKFDFHTHTPASDDYGKGPDQATLKQRTPREWLLDYMRAGVDCVAVTDHNSGAWVDMLKDARATLEQEQPDGYRPLAVFPGVEISVNGGLHLLAILSQTATTSDIDSLLGEVQFRGTKGSSDGVTDLSFTQVVAAIDRAGGLAVPAHVDCPCGLFEKQVGTTLQQTLDCSTIIAMELINPNYERPKLYAKKDVKWTEVLGSDAHHPSGGPGQRFPGTHFTWVKMGMPSIEGLRLALLDGELSIRRSDTETSNPNRHASLAIECIEVNSSRYMGRGGPLRIDLNPWLNAIIGGRGTGKSTLVEFLRTILRRGDEIPDALKDDFEKYMRVADNRDDDGLLTRESILAVTYRKDEARFRIQWNPSGTVDAIQEEAEDGSWRAASGDVRDRFPVQIFSQKQIYQLAKAPAALLGVIDQAPEVERREWDERWKTATSQFLSLRAKARELEAGLSDESRLRGELDDITRRLNVFEQSGHADVLKSYQHGKRQQRVVEDWQASWENAGDRLREVAGALVPDPLDETRFDRQTPKDDELLNHAEQTRAQLERVRERLEVLAAEADLVLETWTSGLAELPWQSDVSASATAYSALKERLATEDAGDPSAYGNLVQKRQLVELRLAELAERREQVRRVQEQADQSLERLGELRRELTSARDAFLRSVLATNEYVRISVMPYSSKDTVEADFRRIIGREGSGFDKDIGAPDGDGLLGRLYEVEPDSANDLGAAELEGRLARLKRELRATASEQPGGLDVRDQRFASHLRRLTPEALDRLDMWFPEDSLDVQYSPSGDGKRFRSIQDGSPGQKTAALLAFMLSHGKEPLVLDQPEDDLDNHLIYELIVAQLRRVKSTRQLIVVTHNPNIVVNGDAEMVVALQPRGGQTQVESQGSLQGRKVRETICTVMEGGREAFALRYRRIALEGRNV